MGKSLYTIVSGCVTRKKSKKERKNKKDLLEANHDIISSIYIRKNNYDVM